MKILICDDDQDELNAISSILMDCKHKNGCSLRGFGKPQAVLDYLEDGNEAELIFLDILMPGMSGVNLALKLRETGYDGFIVFLSSANHFATQSYKAKAFSYLLKPAKKTEVQVLLDKIETTKSAVKNSGIKITTNEGGRFVKFSELVYAEVQNHHVYFHLADRDIIKVYGKLSDYSDVLLSDMRMSQDNRSFILNMDYIQRCENRAVYLKDGTRISIPQGFNEFQTNYFKWMFGKNEHE